MYISYYNWPFLWWSVDAFASICVFLVTLRANLRLRHIPLAPSGVATQMATKRYLRGGGSSFQGHCGILWRHPKSTSWDSNLQPLTLIYVSWFQRIFFSKIHIFFNLSLATMRVLLTLAVLFLACASAQFFRNPFNLFGGNRRPNRPPPSRPAPAPFQGGRPAPSSGGNRR